jgi:predicted Fe-Mo cluster-binding NifX family protein
MMKLCFPVEADLGLDSVVFGHFGSAPLFILVDSDTQAVATIGNQDLGHAHGMCSPLKALNGKAVDAIVVGGIGAGAISKLNALGIKVYRAGQGTVKNNLGQFRQGALPELSAEHACGGHGHAGGCNH